MLQPDAFCEHAMQQNATAAGALPRSLQRFPRRPSCMVLRGPLRGEEGGREGEKRGDEGKERRWTVREGKGMIGKLE